MIRKHKYPEEIQIVSDILDQYYPLSKVTKELLLDKLQRVEKKKGSFIFKQGEKSNQLFFLIKGAVKAYNFNRNGLEEVYWFCFEGDLCCCPYSYAHDIPAHDNNVLYEDSIFYSIDIAYLKELYSHNLEWANWGRCFAEEMNMVITQYMDEQRFMKAKERYDFLLKQYPDITQRVPLQDIASFLGITPVSLSRIRAQK
ncbi:Crp/Fnr family transcriptional regulator [Prolixibacteraceae bacterium JC049]|nr:Crp/Fnr family transcriptional regulator [Prolixibacteraceae bacterium JC049]